MGKDEKKKRKGDDGGTKGDVVDLASRIGADADAVKPPRAKPPPPPQELPEPPVLRYDAAIPSAPKPRLLAAKPDREQGALIQKALTEESEKPQPAIPSPRGAPGPREIDLEATQLPTANDWHRFELALRRVPGVGTLCTENYQHGVLKVRVAYQGRDRLATALREGVPGYRVRVIGEDRATLQILVTSESEERRPS